MASVEAYELPPFCVDKLEGDKDSKEIYNKKEKVKKTSYKKNKVLRFISSAFWYFSIYTEEHVLR